MATIYVATTGNDTTGDGTAGNPYATISNAATVANPGDTVTVADGIYYDGFSTTANGTTTSPITYKSTNKWGAKIVDNGTADPDGWNSGWHLYCDNAIVDGFEFVGGTSWRIGIVLDGENLTVRNCKVRDVVSDEDTYDDLVQGGYGAAGIYGEAYHQGNTNYRVENNVVYDIGPWATRPASSTVQGIYVSQIVGTVIGNLVYNVIGNGLTAYHDAEQINFFNNTIYNCGGGIGFSYDVDETYHAGSYTADYFNVWNNIVVGCTNSIFEDDTMVGRGTHNTYKNNLVYDCTNGISLQNGTTATGTVLTDPLFTSASTGDLHCDAGSPAYQAGYAAAKTLPFTDMDGEINYTNAHIGAFNVFGGLRQMGQSTINAPLYPTQSQAPDVPWDTLGAFATKANANFTELYASAAVTTSNTTDVLRLKAGGITGGWAKYTADSTATAHTAGAANIASAGSMVVLEMTGSLAAARDLSLPTVAALIAAMGYTPAAGNAWLLRVINSSSGNYAWTITKTADSSNWTLAGTMSVAQNTWRDFVLTFATATTCTLQNAGTGTWS